MSNWEEGTGDYCKHWRLGYCEECRKEGMAVDREKMAQDLQRLIQERVKLRAQLFQQKLADESEMIALCREVVLAGEVKPETLRKIWVLSSRMR